MIAPISLACSLSYLATACHPACEISNNNSHTSYSSANDDGTASNSHVCLSAEAYAKWDDEAYRELMSCLNAKPTREGVEACRRRHDQRHSTLKSLPVSKAGYDRRQPSWRTGRWKSLT